MIALDTNIVSELMRPVPDRDVLAFVDSHPSRRLFLPAPVLAELHAGVALLPAGRRRTEIDLCLQDVSVRLFSDRVLPFDAGSARAYGAILAERKRAGHPISIIDAQIAAIVRTAGLALATRDTNDFAGIGLALINPFEALS